MGNGRIIKGVAGFYEVHDGTRIFTCKARGLLRNQHEKPLVGDEVAFAVTDERKGVGNILKILPRKNALIRPAVANVDEMLLVFSSVVPAPNYEMLNRYLVSIHDTGLPVRFIVTKTDLSNEDHNAFIRAQFLNLPCPMHFVSSVTGEGILELKSALRKKTVTLAGPSGVGKSALVNALLSEERMETGTLSQKIDRGKNTTRHAELLYIGEDAYILDTPGFTSVDFDFVKAENLALCFDEFLPHLVNCRFRSCMHLKEPDCAVKTAVEQKLISDSRYDSYVHMAEHLIRLRRY